MRRVWVAAMLLGACAKHLPPAEAPEGHTRVRPAWTLHLGRERSAVVACLEGLESPRYVAFLEPLGSGAVGVTTVDAYGAVEHCAYLDGEVVRREGAELSGAEIAEAGGALFSLGPAMAVVPAGTVAEEVLHEGMVVGWLYWPLTVEEAGTDGGA